MTEVLSPAARTPAVCWRWICALGRAAWSIVKTAMTGPDNTTWAPGRIMGFGVFLVGQCLVVRAAQAVLAEGASVGEWATFFQGVASFEALDSATAIGLVLGMAPTDPGGRWWAREASPPPPAVFHQ